METDENPYTFIPIELQKHSRPSHWDISITFTASVLTQNFGKMTLLRHLGKLVKLKANPRTIRCVKHS